MPLQRYRRRRIPGSFVSASPHRATLTTALTGANNDLIFTAVAGGTAGNDITVEYVVDGTETPLTVDVTDKAIVVNVETDDADAAVSTAEDVREAIAAEEDAAALVIAYDALNSDGSGVVIALADTSLAGGTGAVTGYRR